MSWLELEDRPAPFRKATKYVVVVEDERTGGYWYFTELPRRGHLPRPQAVVLEVRHPDDPSHSAPQHLVDTAASYALKHQLRDFDELWLVFDEDRHHGTNQALQDAGEAGWHVALSRPCFEVWLQLHLVEAPTGTTSQEAKRAWGRLRHAHDRPEWPFEQADILRAIDRARARDTGHTWPAEPPSTHVHRLTERLVT